MVTALVVEWAVVDVVVVEVEVDVGVGYVIKSAAAVIIVMARKCVSAAAPVTVVVAVTVEDGALTASPVATHNMLVFPARSHPTVATPWPGTLMMNAAVLGP